MNIIKHKYCSHHLSYKFFFNFQATLQTLNLIPFEVISKLSKILSSENQKKSELLLC